MKKIFGIIISSLLLYSCATPVGNEYSKERSNKFVASTHMWPKSGFKNFFTGYTFGIYKPHLFDFYAYSNISSEDAAKKSEKKCADFRSEKNWQNKANCKLAFARLTRYGERAQFDKAENERAENERKQVASKPKNSVKKRTSKTGSSGSAFFISNRGHIVTNYHVIEKCSSRPIIKYKGTDVETKVIAKDSLLDLALLKADLVNTKYVSLSNDQPKKLQRIIASGYPFGKYISDDLKFTSGIVSSLKGPGDDSTLIQVDAALNPGNSGGPIVDESSGRLVAVSVMGMKKNISEGQNFGIKSNSVKNFLDANQIKTPSNWGVFKSVDVAQLLEETTLYTFCR